MNGNGNKKYIAFYFIAAFAIAILVMVVPSKFFSSDDPNDGLRLVRDDYEFSYYVALSQWIDKRFDFPAVEHGYPFFGQLYIGIPLVLVDNFQQYEALLFVLNAIWFVGVLLVAWLLLKRFKKPLSYLLLFFLPSFLYFTYNRFDILMMFIVLLSIYMFLEKKYYWSIVLIALSFFVKWFSIILLPIYLLYLRNTTKGADYKKLARRLIAVYLIIFIGITIIGFLVLGEKYFEPYIFQGGREVGPGGIMYYLEIILSYFGLNDLNYLAIALFFLLQFLVPIIVLVFSKKILSFLQSDYQFLLWSLLSILIFVFFVRFISPQWIIWFLPLLILMAKTKQDIWLIIVYDIISYISFTIIRGIFGLMSIEYLVAKALLLIIFVIIIMTVVNKIYARSEGTSVQTYLGASEMS